MIWHLPHIRAIARHVGRPIALIAKPRSAADQIFAAEQTVREVIWLDRNPDNRHGEHDGGIGLLRVARRLRARQFQAVYLLHHSRSIAALTMAAGIPARHGYGFGAQRLFLNGRPYLPPPALRLHPFEQASAWLRLCGIAMPEAEPVLPVAPVARRIVEERLRHRPEGDPKGDIVAIGIGSSEPYKQWRARNFAALARGLDASRIVLVGGHGEEGLAREIQALAGLPSLERAIGWKLGEIAALFSMAAYYVGNDTGVMNMAAAVGARTYCLFGAVAPFLHSSRIVPIAPLGGVSKTDGMARITPEFVLHAIDADRRLKPD
jgi:heptosyltransferase-2